MLYNLLKERHVMSEDKTQNKIEDDNYIDDEDTEKNNERFRDEIYLEAEQLDIVISFFSTIILIIALAASIIFFIKGKWLIGLSILLLGIIIKILLVSINKIFELLAITSAKITVLQEDIDELLERDVVTLYIDKDIKQPNRQARRKK